MICRYNVHKHYLYKIVQILIYTMIAQNDSYTEELREDFIFWLQRGRFTKYLIMIICLNQKEMRAMFFFVTLGINLLIQNKNKPKRNPASYRLKIFGLSIRINSIITVIILTVYTYYWILNYDYVSVSRRKSKTITTPQWSVLTTRKD